MSGWDWCSMIGTLLLVVLYGLYKGRGTRDIDGYFRSSRSIPWYTVLLSVMGTQASAVTFLSGPGQAYTDGMRFVQYYFGLPLAMIVLCITFVPIFHRLNIFTAYEYLEKRFDRKTRTFTAFLFLFSRALATGISVYAPSIILSSILGWNIYVTNLVLGGILIVYSISGGSRAVAYTQQLQLTIIFAGLFFAAYLLLDMLPTGIGFSEAIDLGRAAGKMNVITTGMTEEGFNWNDRFNIFSGVIGGFFLALSYFGTDQSQVGRFLTASSVKESRIGLILNGIVKIPMQYFILLIGVLVFVYYLFSPSPMYFNQTAVDRLKETAYHEKVVALEQRHTALQSRKDALVAQLNSGATVMSVDALIQSLTREQQQIRGEMTALIKESGLPIEQSDTNYIFLRFVMDHMPKGLIGLLIAVIFLAAWGSIAATLNALSSTTLIDFHLIHVNANPTPEESIRLSRLYTLLWGIFCIVFAQFATNLGSLIETVNILGSWFYGVILGIFLVAFYLKHIGGHAVFYAAILGEVAVLTMYALTDIGWLWLNAIGALVVPILALILQAVIRQRSLSVKM
ncbi:MAG: sodium:solute symporter [Bacteroidetes bacterium]|nr:sodium:solute symporter [Bacteroidota bacterium]